MTINVSDFRKGMKIELEGVPYEITEFQFVKPGKGQGMYKCRLRDMIAGGTFDRTFRAVDHIDTPNVETREMEYSYAEGDHYVFIENKTYEQVTLSKDVVGDQKYYLSEGLQVDVLFHNGRALQITMPSYVEKEIKDTEPGCRGDTANNVMKPARIDTGYEFGVPLFINVGDVVRVDTRTGKYHERVSRG